MEPARSTWTDERLDDFRRAVDERFDRVDERFDRIDRELLHLGARMDAQTGRIDALHRTLVYVCTTQAAALFGTLITLIVKQY